MKTQTKNQIKKELKEDYFLIDKGIVFYLLSVIIGLCIGSFLIFFYIFITENIDNYNQDKIQEGRTQLINEIFESYGNIPCGEKFKLVNISQEGNKEITIKKENCLKILSAEETKAYRRGFFLFDNGSIELK